MLNIMSKELNTTRKKIKHVQERRFIAKIILKSESSIYSHVFNIFNPVIRCRLFALLDSKFLSSYLPLCSVC